MRTHDNRDLTAMELLYLARIEALEAHIKRLNQTLADRDRLIGELREELAIAEGTYSKLRLIRGQQ